MERTTLYLVRHAHSVYSPDEWSRPLSSKGIKGADHMTALLKNEAIEKVISSPYKRAIQTVEGIASYFQLDIEIIDDLMERKLAEYSVPDFREAMDKVWGNPDFAFEGGESNKTAQQRGVNAIKYILGKYVGKNIVIGTHGNIMVLIMNYFDKRYNYDFWRSLSMPDLYKLVFIKDRLIHVEKLSNT